MCDIYWLHPSAYSKDKNCEIPFTAISVTELLKQYLHYRIHDCYSQYIFLYSARCCCMQQPSVYNTRRKHTRTSSHDGTGTSTGSRRHLAAVTGAGLALSAYLVKTITKYMCITAALKYLFSVNQLFKPERVSNISKGIYTYWFKTLHYTGQVRQFLCLCV